MLAYVTRDDGTFRAEEINSNMKRILMLAMGSMLLIGATMAQTPAASTSTQTVKMSKKKAKKEKKSKAPAAPAK